MHREYFVIPALDMTSAGPVAEGPGAEEQLVHLYQGDLDGACGPYTIFMGLLTLGLVNREDVTAWGAYDKRTKVGKLMALMSDGYSTLFTEGTRLPDLVNLIDGAFRSDLTVIQCEEVGTNCRAFVKEHVLAGHPVVLGLNYQEGGHWVLVVGLDSVINAGNREVHRFLVLDPGAPTSTVSPWNGLIEARGSGGRYPYTWWNQESSEETKVAFDQALALMRNANN